MSDPETEYLAAKEAFMAAHKRLSAAKRALKAEGLIGDRKRVEQEVALLRAFVNGATKQELGAMVGQKTKTMDHCVRKFYIRFVGHAPPWGEDLSYNEHIRAHARESLAAYDAWRSRA